MKKISSLSAFLLMLTTTASYGMEEEGFDKNKLRAGSFLFLEPTSSQNEELTPMTVVPFSTEKVSTSQWNDMAESFLDRVYKFIAASMEIGKLDAIFQKEYKSVFAQYNETYQMLLSKNKKAANDVGRLLEPLGRFVAVFESLFDALKSEYRTKENYAANKAYLEKTVFSLVQKTFNTYMKAYQKHVPEQRGATGILQHKSEPFSVISEGRKKYICYKKDENGFLLFTLFPHEQIGKSYYKTYLPYLDMRSSHYISDMVVFSLDSQGKPVFEENPGLILYKRDYSMTPYRGNSTSLPYTNAPSLGVGSIVSTDTIKTLSRLVDSKTEPPELTQEEKKILKMVAKNSGLSKKENIFLDFKSFSPHSAMTLVEFIDEALEGQESTFVPFPRTFLEEAEVTYLFLCDLQHRCAENKAQPEDIRFMTYLEKTAFPGEKLEQIVEAYEKELLNEYVNEEEEAIRLQQQERSRRVAQGELYQKPAKSKKKLKEFKKPSSKEEVKSSFGSPREKAKRRLEKLVAESKGGSIKFRKFMQLVNFAKQDLEALGLQTTAELTKGSHGTIKIGDVSQTLVRPHGGAKEKSVSAKSRKRILSGIVEGVLKQFSEKEKQI